MAKNFFPTFNNMLQDIQSKHVMLMVVLASAMLGVFLWNRTCILSAEIGEISNQLSQIQQPVCAPLPPKVVNEVQPKAPRAQKKEEEKMEVVYGGKASKAAAMETSGGSAK